MGENFHKLVDFRGENFRRLFTGAAKKHHTPKFCRENLHKFIASKVSRYTVWDQFTIMDVHMHVYNFLQLRKDVSTFKWLWGWLKPVGELWSCLGIWNKRNRSPVLPQRWSHCTNYKKIVQCTLASFPGTTLEPGNEARLQCLAPRHRARAWIFSLLHSTNDILVWCTLRSPLR